MNFIILSLLLPCLALGWRWPSLENVGISLMGFDAGDTCGFTRDDALQCIAKYVDTNGDREISADEFEHAKKEYLPKQAQMARWIARRLGYDVTIKDVMYGCDVNKDGHLTLSDWQDGAKVCLPGKGDLCKFSTVCDIAKKLNAKTSN